jgi:hypothetical protein
MAKGQTFFEQVPLETVMRICREKNLSVQLEGGGGKSGSEGLSSGTKDESKTPPSAGPVQQGDEP